jgi:hypothetical protein
VWIFSLVSYLQTPPVIWFLLALLGISIYYVIRHSLSWIAGVIFIATLIGIGIVEPKTLWSPYNRLDIIEAKISEGNSTIPLGYTLTVQHWFFEGAYNLSDDFIKQVNAQFPENIEKINDLASQYDRRLSSFCRVAGR